MPRDPFTPCIRCISPNLGDPFGELAFRDDSFVKSCAPNRNHYCVRVFDNLMAK